MQQVTTTHYTHHQVSLMVSRKSYALGQPVRQYDVRHSIEQSKTASNTFLPRDAMRKRGLCRRTVSDWAHV